MEERIHEWHHKAKDVWTRRGDFGEGQSFCLDEGLVEANAIKLFQHSYAYLPNNDIMPSLIVRKCVCVCVGWPVSVFNVRA